MRRMPASCPAAFIDEGVFLMHRFHTNAPASIGCAVLIGFTLFFGFARSGVAQGNTPTAPSPGLNPKLPTLFVVGDSTARNNANGAQGWGDPFAGYFDTTRINVANRAMAGRSSRTFITEGRWDKVLGEMKAGDFVLI